MKRITAILFFMFFIEQTNAQYLVVGNGSSGGSVIPMQDTIISSLDPTFGYCSAFHYYFNLDQDSIPDIVFYLECSMGGLGSHYKISLTSVNDFSIHLDTGYTEHFQFINSSGQVLDSTRNTPVVRKYNYGDTIFSHQGLLTTGEKLLYYSNGHNPPCVYNNVNLFLEDTSYIALEKSNGDLYYLKIFVPWGATLELICAKTNAQITDIGDNEFLSNVLFPNPANEIINFRKAYDLIQIYSLQGSLLIEKELFDSQNAVDVSHLKNGFFIVKLKKGNNTYTLKLLKL